ncbi:MAG: glutaredoxin family protein [Methanomicrobiales archaeon]|nr:glutaredoxin family protein [Methanomicrobiales archaeon]
MNWVHHKGRKVGEVRLYALSTCGWCKRTRELLEGLGIEFSHLYVDLLPEEEMESVIEEVRRYNPSVSFPTLVIGGKRTIIGFREKEIQEALG